MGRKRKFVDGSAELDQIPIDSMDQIVSNDDESQFADNLLLLLPASIFAYVCSFLSLYEKCFRLPVSSHSMKNAFDQSSDQPVSRIQPNNQRIGPISNLLRYAFIYPIMVNMLTDTEVLSRMLPTTKVMKSMLTGYEVKSEIKQPSRNNKGRNDIASKLDKPNRYLPVRITRMCNVSEPNVSEYRYLKSARFSSVYRETEYGDWVPCEPNMDIRVGMLPAFLTELDLSPESPMQIIQAGVFDATPHLTVLRCFNQPLSPNFLPRSLKELTLGSGFKGPLTAGSLPPSLTSLEIMGRWNHPLEADVLPLSLTSLHLSSAWNHPLESGVLPLSLTSLHLSSAWNHPLVARVLPPNLKKLTLGKMFDHPLPPGAIPSSVRFILCLSGSEHTNRPGAFPSGVTCITFKDHHRPHLQPGVLPDTLESLVIDCWYPHNFSPGVLPLSLTSLDLVSCSICQISCKYCACNSAGDLPPQLKFFRMHSTYDRPIGPNILPNQLSHLMFDRIISPVAPGIFPNSLRYLNLGNYFDQTLLPGTIPHGLTELVFGSNLLKRLRPGSIPMSVTSLTIGNHCVELSPGCFPSSITHLVGHTSKLLRPRVIPNHVTHLTLDISTKRSVQDGVVPPSVTHLVLGVNAKQPYRYDNLPPSVTHLSFWLCRHLDEMPSFIPAHVRRVDIIQWDHQCFRSVVPSTVTEVYRRYHTVGEEQLFALNRLYHKC